MQHKNYFKIILKEFLRATKGRKTTSNSEGLWSSAVGEMVVDYNSSEAFELSKRKRKKECVCVCVCVFNAFPGN